MNQQSFEFQNRDRWNEIDRLTQRLLKKRRVNEAAVLPSLYRQLCADIALAQHRMYGARLCAELNERLIRCRQVLAGTDELAGRGFAKLMLQDFPRAVRRNARLFWLGMALFIGPMILMVIASYIEPRWIFSVLGPNETKMMDWMYGKEDAKELLRKEFGSDFGMFGFYVMNNITIGLRMVGSGLFAMVGSMVALGYQGVFIGAMEGYVHYAGNTERFYAFVAGHSAFELVGIVICGVAGMRLGQAVLKPGRLTRGAALAVAGKRALPLVYGGALLIFFAAFIEGFWSAGPAPNGVKYAVGIGNAAALAAYFLFCGRAGEEADEA
ncbi:MAG TPA: stage II sporulation protein M [Verrucomicrobiales bacterium]|nr:stage II sporulation protein M [Verrucomicrobiales bacterium]